MRSLRWSAWLLAPLVAACGYTKIRDQCPSCTVIERGGARPAIPEGTVTLAILVEGILGFGWEWDLPQRALAHRAATVTEVFDWSPWSSLGRDAEDLAEILNATFERAPASLRHVLVVGHSAGGLITAFASSRLRVPPGLVVRVVNVGAPYAGLHLAPSDDGDFIWSPFAAAIGTTFTRYPRPARGVTVESWVTSFPADPVMRRRFGHDPADPKVGPPGPRHRLPLESDHNKVLGAILCDVLKRLGD